MSMKKEAGHQAIELDEKAAEVIKEAAALALKEEGIVSFLKVCAENYLQDYRNQLLIWRQRENARTVAGKNVLEKLGFAVSDTAKPVTVLYPVIVCTYEGRLRTKTDGTPVMKEGRFVYDRAPEFLLKYQPVPAYDLADAVSGQNVIPRVVADIDIFNAVRGNISFAVEMDTENSFPGKGVVDYVNGRFLLKQGLTDRQRDQVLLELFADYFTETKLKEDRFLAEKLSEKGFHMLSFLLKAALLARFDMLTEKYSLMPLSDMGDLEACEKMRLLMCLNLGLQAVMEILSGRNLTFDETAICNSLLRQNQDGKATIGLVSAKFPFREEDSYIDHVMERLAQGLAGSREDRLKKLCDAIRNQSLATYPPYPFP